MSQTTSIANANPAKGSPAMISPKSRSVVYRDGVTGLLVRCLIVTAAMLVAAVGLWMALHWGLAFADLGERRLFGITLLIWMAMMTGLVFSEYPRGNQAAMLRVGLATFCRTGFPLLVVLLAVNYATRLNSVAACVGILYAVGLASSLSLEISRMGFSLFKSTS